MTLRSLPLVLREQLLLTLKIEKINLKHWTNNESLCDSVFCVVRANTYMNLTDCIGMFLPLIKQFLHWMFPLWKIPDLTTAHRLSSDDTAPETKGEMFCQSCFMC